MEVWAVANQKGGAGKSTSSIHLAGIMSQANLRVAILDQDDQHSATHWLTERLNNYTSSPFDVIKRTEQVTKSYIASLKEQYDLLIIDLPAGVRDHQLKGKMKIRESVLAAVETADLVVIPFAFTAMDVRSTSLFAASIKQIIAARNSKYIMVINRLDLSDRVEVRDSKVMIENWKKHNFNVATTIIPHYKSFTKPMWRGNCASDSLTPGRKVFIELLRNDIGPLMGRSYDTSSFSFTRPKLKESA